MLNYTHRPLTDRTWLRASNRREWSRFRTTWPGTLDLLEREIEMLNGRHVVIGVDVREQDIRNDGRLRADARADNPAVEVAFESKHGPLLYRCDQYHALYSGPMRDWQHNVRAIALTLEALRAVDRHGASSHGEQYRGYKQIAAGNGESSGMTATDAAGVVLRLAGVNPEAVAVTSQLVQQALRQARRKAHPDVNDGDRQMWNLLDSAEQVLTRAGWL